MHTSFGRLVLLAALPVTLLVPRAVRADQWTVPTAEELKMTAQPEVPGAVAVYLFREEITEDSLHMWSHYVRLKVLTEEGKSYANVQLQSVHASYNTGYTVEDIAGRTIEPDGTIVPFTGKPYEKVLSQTKSVQFKAKVFTLPAVQVGSILEYRYTLRWDDHVFQNPSWDVQGELFTRRAHYLWKPTDKQLLSSSHGHEQTTNGISWSRSLPQGVDVKQTRLPSGQSVLELSIENVPPVPQEEFMPPLLSAVYHVTFYYTPYSKLDDFWKTEGGWWSKESNKFMTNGSAVQDLLHKSVLEPDGPEVKLHKLYDAVMTFENTDYTRQYTSAEEHMQGLKQIRNADDVIVRKRGSSDEIALTFAALARAAGQRAYVVRTTDRTRQVFTPNYLTMDQLDNDLVMINIDGKERFFDPGSRYCPFGHLAWQHSMTQGIRQTDSGVTFASTPANSYKASRTSRVADVKLEDGGRMTGSVLLTFTGDPALRWQHELLRGDEASLRESLKSNMEEMLPGGTEVTVGKIDGLSTTGTPLTVNYTISGSLGTMTGKRVFLPSRLFVVNQKPTFPHDTRKLGVYFHFPEVIQDALRVNYPAGYTVESAPKVEAIAFKDAASYNVHSKSAGNSVTVWRDLAIGGVYFPVEEYPELKAFYNNFERSDRDPLILKAAASVDKAVLNASPQH